MRKDLALLVAMHQYLGVFDVDIRVQELSTGIMDQSNSIVLIRHGSSLVLGRHVSCYVQFLLKSSAQLVIFHI